MTACLGVRSVDQILFWPLQQFRPPKVDRDHRFILFTFVPTLPISTYIHTLVRNHYSSLCITVAVSYTHLTLPTTPYV